MKGVNVFIKNNAPDDMVRLRLDCETFRKLNSSLVMTSIALFGQTDPYRNYKGPVVVNFHVIGRLFSGYR